MALPGEVVLRQRICYGSGCHAVFWICQHCDRDSVIVARYAAAQPGDDNTVPPTAATSGVWRAGSIIATGNVPTATVTRQLA